MDADYRPGMANRGVPLAAVVAGRLAGGESCVCAL
jgi:hypothetical protein